MEYNQRCWSCQSRDVWGVEDDEFDRFQRQMGMDFTMPAWWDVWHQECQHGEIGGCCGECAIDLKVQCPHSPKRKPADCCRCLEPIRGFCEEDDCPTCPRDPMGPRSPEEEESEQEEEGLGFKSQTEEVSKEKFCCAEHAEVLSHHSDEDSSDETASESSSTTTSSERSRSPPRCQRKCSPPPWWKERKGYPPEFEEEEEHQDAVSEKQMSREIRAASARIRDAMLYAIEKMAEANSAKNQAAADDVTSDVTGALGRAATADDVTHDVTGAQRRGVIAADVTSDVTGAQERDPPAYDVTHDVTGVKEKGTASDNVVRTLKEPSSMPTKMHSSALVERKPT